VHPVPRWAAAESALDLVRTLAAEDPALRRSLPLGVDLSDPDAATEDVAAVVTGLKEWLDRIDPGMVTDRLRDRTWAQVRPQPVDLVDGIGPVSGLAHHFDTPFSCQPGGQSVEEVVTGVDEEHPQAVHSVRPPVRCMTLGSRPLAPSRPMAAKFALEYPRIGVP